MARGGSQEPPEEPQQTPRDAMRFTRTHRAQREVYRDFRSKYIGKPDVVEFVLMFDFFLIWGAPKVSNRLPSTRGIDSHRLPPGTDPPRPMQLIPKFTRAAICLLLDLGRFAHFARAGRAMTFEAWRCRNSRKIQAQRST